MIRVLAIREFNSLFQTPFAWVLLALLQLILGYLFMAQIDTYLIAIQPRTAALETAPGVTDLIVAPLYGNAGVVMLLIVPLLTMRVISAERQEGTFSLLSTAPLSNADIVIGKYLGIVGFNFLVVVLITSMPLSIELGTHLDFGRLAACILALLLLLASFTAIGIYISSLCRRPATAASVTFGVLLAMWIVDWGTATSANPAGVLEYLSILSHFNRLRSGLIATADLMYFIILICLFITLAVLQLDAQRNTQ